MNEEKRRKSRFMRASDESVFIGSGIEVKESKIIKAGRGLFATKTFEKGSWITSFEGNVISHTEAIAKRLADQAQYIVMCERGRVALDCFPKVVGGKAGGQFANHSTSQNNAKLVLLYNPKTLLSWPFLQATKRIESGEEITYNYGKGAFTRDHSK